MQLRRIFHAGARLGAISLVVSLGWSLGRQTAAAEQPVLRIPGFTADDRTQRSESSAIQPTDYFAALPQPPTVLESHPPSTGPGGDQPIDGRNSEAAVEADPPEEAGVPRALPPVTTTPGGPLAANAPLPSRSSLRVASASRLPYMIGDTGAGTCFAFGGIFDAELSHPTLGCSRLNISENNSPLPSDRLYYSYRHYSNATPTRVWQYEQVFDLDVHTIGGEKTFFDGMMSMEMRLPLEYRLNSEPFTYDVLDPPFFLDPAFFPPGFEPMGGGRRTELGNVSLLLKALLIENREFALSAGLGLSLPTSRDVEYLVTTDDTLVFPSVPGLEADSSILLDVFASNETVYLAPFLGWVYQPKQRFYHQGFFQVEVAANPSSITVAGDGLQDFYFEDVFIGSADWATPFPTSRADLVYQTLMRLNLGFGYLLVDEPNADLLQQLAAIMEIHWTSTLNDATITSVPIEDTLGGAPLQTIEFGNPLNRVDIVNLVMGCSARIGGWVWTNGFTVPLGSDDDERGFDFEYNLQIQRPF